MDLIITILSVVTKDLPISPRFTPYNFLSRCKFSTLTTRQPMVEFYLLTFPRFPFRKKEHKSYFGKNRTHDFRTSRCAGYLLDHSPKKQKRNKTKEYIDNCYLSARGCRGACISKNDWTKGRGVNESKKRRKRNKTKQRNQKNARMIQVRTTCG